MEKQNEKEAAAIIINAVIGDALGTPLEGMTRAHLAAVFRRLDSYTDPEPALKNKLEKWRKPALYSSLSQFIILIALSTSRRGFQPELFKAHLEENETDDALPYGVFRHPGPVEKSIIAGNGAAPLSDARCIAYAIPLVVAREGAALQERELLALLSFFTTDPDTVAAALIYGFLLHRMLETPGFPLGSLVPAAAEITRELNGDLQQRPELVFNAGLNPLAMADSLSRYIALFGELQQASQPDAAEAVIIRHVNRTLATPITRATVHFPLALLPWTLFHTAHHAAAPEGILPATARQGGYTAAMTALTGALTAATNGLAATPELLIESLVNRKRLYALIRSISEGEARTQEAAEFLESEKSLTRKEQEELQAKLKHYRKKSPPVKDRAARERELTGHVVESWTKLDKAKWKKERKKQDKINNEK